MLEGLKRMMDEEGIGHEELAEALSISRQSVDRLANGGAETNIETLIKLADFFDTSVDYLIGRTELRSGLAAYSFWNVVLIHTACGLEMRRSSDIVFFERRGKQTLVQLTAGCLWTRESIKSIEARGLPDTFVKCHQSFIVNLEFASRVADDVCALQNGFIIPISRANRKAMRTRLLDCMRADSACGHA